MLFMVRGLTFPSAREIIERKILGTLDIRITYAYGWFMGKKETRTVRVIVAMTPREKADLDRKARRLKETISGTIREAISQLPTPRA